MGKKQKKGICCSEVSELSEDLRQLKVKLCGQKIKLSENSEISIHKSTQVLNIVTNNFTAWWASERLGEKEGEKIGEWEHWDVNEKTGL